MQICKYPGCKRLAKKAELCPEHYLRKYHRVNGDKSLYAVVCDEVEPPKVKFGVAKKPESRLSSLQTGSPVLLSMKGHIRGSYEIEERLHKKLEDFHFRGEWFVLEGLAREFCDLIAANDADEVYHRLDVWPPMTLDEKMNEWLNEMKEAEDDFDYGPY